MTRDRITCRGSMRTIAILVAAATAVPLSAQFQPPASPITYSQALELAMSRNLGVAAARRLRAIRESAVRTSRQYLNPAIGFETTKDTPHQVLSFDLPVELGGRRSRRIDLSTEEVSLADADL